MKKQIKRVGEFEFSNRSGDSASAMVKFEGAEPIKASFKMEYMGYQKPEKPTIHFPHEFEDAAKVFGVELDTEAVIAEFLTAREIQAEKSKQEDYEQRGVEYDNSGLHLVIEHAANYPEVEAKLSKTREEYQENDHWLSAELTIGTVTAEIGLDDGGKFTCDRGLFDSKRRWSKLDNMFKRIIEAAGIKAAQNERMTKEYNDKKDRKIAIVAKLKELGYNDVSDEKWTYNERVGDFRQREYGDGETTLKIAEKQDLTLVSHTKGFVSLRVSVPLDKLEALIALIKREKS
jgi:hypothetical protein